MKKIEVYISLKTVPLSLDLLIGFIDGEIERSDQCLMHPGFALGILILEFSLPGKHEVNQQYTDDVNKNDLDRLPEFDNALNPVHEVKLG